MPGLTLAGAAILVASLYLGRRLGGPHGFNDFTLYFGHTGL